MRECRQHLMGMSCLMWSRFAQWPKNCAINYAFVVMWTDVWAFCSDLLGRFARNLLLEADTGEMSQN